MHHSSGQLPPSIPLFLSDIWECTDQFDVKKLAEPKTTSKLTVVPTALELIDSIEKPIAVLSICGPFRTGKSYFASSVLGVPNTFKVGHKHDPCTHGVWMATTVLECDDYVLLILDMEGTSAVGNDATDDPAMNSFLVMTTLISSYLIYNSVKVPNKEDLNNIM